MTEIYWVARYSDGSFLTQYNEDGSENKYAQIERSKLESFELWRGHEYPRLVLRVNFDSPDKKLIYRRRVHKTPGRPDLDTYLAGWQIKVFEHEKANKKSYKGRTIQCIAVYFVKDDRVDIIDGWRDDAFFEKPQVHPHEGEDWE